MVSDGVGHEDIVSDIGVGRKGKVSDMVKDGARGKGRFDIAGRMVGARTRTRQAEGVPPPLPPRV